MFFAAIVQKGSRWRASDWEFALSFQNTFKVIQDRTCMVRRRMWFRTRSVIARDMSPTRSRSFAAPRGDESARSGAGADSVDVGGPAVVRFAEDTVYERELPNKRWRVTASTRAAPHWARQYFADCAACEISPVRAVAVSCALAYFTRN